MITWQLTFHSQDSDSAPNSDVLGFAKVRESNNDFD